jgi:hypothetical protein
MRLYEVGWLVGNNIFFGFLWIGDWRLEMEYDIETI